MFIYNACIFGVSGDLRGNKNNLKTWKMKISKLCLDFFPELTIYKSYSCGNFN